MGDSDSPVICTIHVCNRADPETSMFVMGDSDSPVICTIHICKRANPETSVFVMSDSDGPLISTIHVCKRANPKMSVFAVVDLRGVPHYGPKFSQFHAVFQEIWQNHRLAPHPWRIGAPSYCNIIDCNFRTSACNQVY